MYSTLNYMDNGGDKTVIGGELDIATGGTITSNGVQAEAIANPTDLASALTAIASINALLKAIGATK